MQYVIILNNSFVWFCYTQVIRNIEILSTRAFIIVRWPRIILLIPLKAKNYFIILLKVKILKRIARMPNDVSRYMIT